MHKLIPVVYGMLTSQTPYAVQIDGPQPPKTGPNDADNKRRATEPKKSLHRLPAAIRSAPRSRPSVQKMKEQKASQSSVVEEHCGLTSCSRIKLTKNQNLYLILNGNFRRYSNAEVEGFEPPDPDVVGINGFRDRPIRPLWHTSGH